MQKVQLSGMEIVVTVTGSMGVAQFNTGGEARYE